MSQSKTFGQTLNQIENTLVTALDSLLFALNDNAATLQAYATDTVTRAMSADGFCGCRINLDSTGRVYQLADQADLIELIVAKGHAAAVAGFALDIYIEPAVAIGPTLKHLEWKIERTSADFTTLIDLVK